MLEQMMNSVKKGNKESLRLRLNRMYKSKCGLNVDVKYERIMLSLDRV